MPHPSVDFRIEAKGEISVEFIKLNISSFHEAAQWVKHLPYGRNKDKSNLVAVFSERRGTCGTKHALLKKLAIENEFSDLQLFIALFNMNGVNTPKIARTLETHGLSHIPEAHNYLKYKGEILDFTKPGFPGPGFSNDLVEEIEIMPDQITDYKVEYHKKYLAEWGKKENLHLGLDEIWSVREQCIEALSDQNKNL